MINRVIRFKLVCYVLLSVLFFFVFGCDDKSQKDTGESKSCPKLVFRFATEVKPDNKVWEAARLIKEALEKTSPDGVIKDGEIKVQFYDQVGYNGNGANHASMELLSPKERELLQMISEGEASKTVAKKLQISVKTVDARRRDIMRKLKLDSVALLTKFAVREGLTSLNY